VDSSSKINVGAQNNQELVYIGSYVSCNFILLLLLDFIYRGSLSSIFTTLIYHKVLISNKTEQDTEQDKQTKILVEQFTYILTQYIYTVLQWTMHDENMRTYLKNKTHYCSGMPWFCTHLRYIALETLTEGECCTWTGKLFQIDTPDYLEELLYNSHVYQTSLRICKGSLDKTILDEFDICRLKCQWMYTM